MAKYVCSNNHNHQADEMTIDGFCPQPECYGVGFLIEQKEGIYAENPKEIGLCILLMDSSDSMNEPAFEGNPLTKKQLIAGSASAGIFELQKISNKKDAFICVVMFEDKQKIILMKSLEELFSAYPTANEFSKFLISSFTQGMTDINGALAYAKKIIDDLLKNGDLSKHGGPRNVKPIKQSILTKLGDQKIVPNIRVLIYTDGEDVVTGKISANPFRSDEVDVLMGAFFGKSEELGAAELKRHLSKCPVHNVDQFFLINDPSRIQTLRHLFRMASGASGFCPVCLAQDKE